MDEWNPFSRSPEEVLRWKIAVELREIAEQIDEKYGWRHAQGAYMAADAVDPDVEDWDA